MLYLKYIKEWLLVYFNLNLNAGHTTINTKHKRTFYTQPSERSGAPLTWAK